MSAQATATALKPLDLSLELVGRDDLLSLLADVSLGDGRARIVSLIGEAGTGKSALASALVDIAVARGWEVSRLAPEDPRVPARTSDARRRLMVLDGRSSTLHPRDAVARVIMRMQDADRLVLVGRRAPLGCTTDDDALVAELTVARMASSDSAVLAAELGVPEDRRDALVDWAEGFPLALVLGARFLQSAPAWLPCEYEDPPELTERLLRRVLDDRLELLTPALAAAAYARRLDRPTLSAMLPSSTAEDFESLTRLTIVEDALDGLRVHSLARRAISRHLSHTDPQLDRDLRRRLADHLLATARRRGISVAADLSLLSRPISVGRGFRWHDGMHARLGRREDAPQVQSALEAAGLADWWTSVQPWFEQAPERIVVSSSSDGSVLAYAIAVTPEGAPQLAFEDSLLGPWLEHAASDLVDRNAILWRDSVDLRRPDPCAALTRAVAHCHVASVIYSGLANPRYAYLPRTLASEADSVGFLERLSPTRLTALDRTIGGREMICNFVDYGPGGLLGAQRDLVYYEAGLLPTAFAAERKSGRSAVEAAVRNYQRPVQLAQSPLAVGSTAAERVASVRQQIDRAVEEIFGSSYSEQALREVVMNAYIRPSTGHERAAYDLNMSRTTYFRKLRIAMARIINHLGD